MNISGTTASIDEPEQNDHHSLKRESVALNIIECMAMAISQLRIGELMGKHRLKTHQASMVPKKVYGEFVLTGTTFAITSPNFSRGNRIEGFASRMKKDTYSFSFLGANVPYLTNADGRIVGWDAEALNNYNQAAGRS